MGVFLWVGLALLIPLSFVDDFGLAGGPVGVGGGHRSEGHHLLVEEVLVLLKLVDVGGIVAHLHLIAVGLERVVLLVVIGRKGGRLVETLGNCVVDRLACLIVSCQPLQMLLQRRFLYPQQRLLGDIDGLL